MACSRVGATNVSRDIGSVSGGGWPCSARTVLYSSTCRASVSNGACGFRYHVSPVRAMRRTMPSPFAAIQMRGCGCWMGRTPMWTPVTFVKRPSNVTSPPAQSCRARRRFSNIRAMRSSWVTPNASYSSSR